MKLVASAEIVTVWGPSKIASSTAVRVTEAETCPMGMMSVAGTVASEVSLLKRLTVSALVVLVLRETVTEELPPFSEMLGSAIERIRVGTSSSVTSSCSESPVNPSASAEMVTVWVPSTMASSTAVRVTVAETSPAGIARVVGRVDSEVSSLERLTVRALVVSVLRETVTIVLPPFSEMLEARNERVRVGASSSRMSRVSAPSTNPEEVAVAVTVWVSSRMASSTAVSVKVAEACPARMVTIAGTVAAVSSSLERPTVRSTSVSVLRVTVTVVVPPFSEILGSAIERARVGTSSSVTSTVPEPPVNPETVAEMVTVWGPSTMASPTAVRVTVAETPPAGMVRVVGRVASDTSSLERFTVRALVVSVLRETVTEVLPPSSEMLRSAIERVRVGARTSKAPISTVPWEIRGNPEPRWSFARGLLSASTASAFVPASIATEFAASLWVAVAPPLSERTMSIRSEGMEAVVLL